jgi:hypothetical protein
MDARGKIKAFKGTHKIGRYVLGKVGSGSRVVGNSTGLIKGYNYKDIYSIYGIPYSQPTTAWTEAFKKDEDQKELKQVFHMLQPIDKMHTLNFWMQGNDTNIQEMDIYYGVIRLQWGSDIKDFVVLNNSSASAATVPAPGVILTRYGGFFPFSETGSAL